MDTCILGRRVQNIVVLICTLGLMKWKGSSPMMNRLLNNDSRYSKTKNQGSLNQRLPTQQAIVKETPVGHWSGPANDVKCRDIRSPLLRCSHHR